MIANTEVLTKVQQYPECVMIAELCFLEVLLCMCLLGFAVHPQQRVTTFLLLILLAKVKAQKPMTETSCCHQDQPLPAEPETCEKHQALLIFIKHVCRCVYVCACTCVHACVHGHCMHVCVHEYVPYLVSL